MAEIRKRAFFTPDQPDNLRLVFRRLRVPADAEWLGLITGALQALTEEKNWNERGTYSVEETCWRYREIIDDMTGTDAWMLGWIVPYITDDCPEHMLPCNGAMYDRVDYPELYALLHSAFIVDADTFRTPNLQDRFILGMSGGHQVGEMDGEEEVGLTVDNLPSHNHTTQPHSHNYTGAVAAIDAKGELPLPGATAAPLITATSVVAVNNTGGNREHNNMPPYMALHYGVVAR